MDNISQIEEENKLLKSFIFGLHAELYRADRILKIVLTKSNYQKMAEEEINKRDAEISRLLGIIRKSKNTDNIEFETPDQSKEISELNAKLEKYGAAIKKFAMERQELKARYEQLIKNRQ